MFSVIKIKPLIIGLVAILISILLGVGVVTVVAKDNVVPKTNYTIILDAGHGGRDGGCSGLNGTKESEINLQITKVLKRYLESLDINVVLTRADGNGLYSATAENYKQSDMEKRLEIIDNTKPNMIISIHQNSFRDKTQRGAQVFYQKDDENSKIFADCIQSQLITQLPNARNEANFGDYYLLKESSVSCVIVECGYLTNPEECILLSDTNYQNKIAYAIMCGVVKYFDMCDYKS